MQARVFPGPLAGAVPAIASKSMAHRLIICAALADAPTEVVCNTTCVDIETTVGCLNALGACIERAGDVYRVEPVPRDARGRLACAKGSELFCSESGSTMRFMLPVAAALGADARFTGAPRLAARPLSPLYEELIAGGCDLTEQGTFPLSCTGTLRPGRFELPGNVSSQFVSGLLLASLAMDRPSEVVVAGRIESRPYIDLTVSALASFGVNVAVEELEPAADGEARTRFSADARTLRSPGRVVVEGDWSNAAFWLCAGALSDEPVTVEGLDLASPQGDRGILGALTLFGARVQRGRTSCTVFPHRLHGYEMSAADIPDLVPVISCVASLAEGTTVIRDCARLRIKESDRLATTAETLNALGGDVRIEGDSLVIQGVGSLSGGRVRAHSDHRIAMTAAVAATRAAGPVVIDGAEAVSKSYPGFFDDFRRLGGSVELDGTVA